MTQMQWWIVAAGVFTLFIITAGRLYGHWRQQRRYQQWTQNWQSERKAQAMQGPNYTDTPPDEFSDMCFRVHFDPPVSREELSVAMCFFPTQLEGNPVHYSLQYQGLHVQTLVVSVLKATVHGALDKGVWCCLHGYVQRLANRFHAQLDALPEEEAIAHLQAFHQKLIKHQCEVWLFLHFDRDQPREAVELYLEEYGYRPSDRADAKGQYYTLYNDANRRRWEVQLLGSAGDAIHTLKLFINMPICWPEPRPLSTLLRHAHELATYLSQALCLIQENDATMLSNHQDCALSIQVLDRQCRPLNDITPAIQQIDDVLMQRYRQMEADGLMAGSSRNLRLFT